MILETEHLELIPLLPHQLRKWVEDIPALEQDLKCTYKAEPMERCFLGIVKGQLEITEKNPDLNGFASQRILQRCGFVEIKRRETVWWQL